MTELELQAEAERRVAGMSEEEKRSIWGFSEEDNVILDHAAEVGAKKLTPEELKRFRVLVAKHGSRMVAGGYQWGGMLHSLKEDYGISWDDLNKGAKNPYKRNLLMMIIIGLIIAVVAAGLGVLGSRLDNDILKIAAVVLAGGQMYVAAGCLGAVQYCFRFGKLQKKVINGEMDEEMIRSKTLKLLLEERDQLWSKGNETADP